MVKEGEREALSMALREDGENHPFFWTSVWNEHSQVDREAWAYISQCTVWLIMGCITSPSSDIPVGTQVLWIFTQ